VGGEIGPNQTKTFTLTLNAPATPGNYTTDWRMLRELVTWFGPTVSKTIPVIDNLPPSVPTNLTANTVSTSEIDLSWSPSTDNVGVSNYWVYRDSALIGSSATTNYNDTSCSPGTNYSYQVSARDGAANESAKSTAVQATTPAASLVLLYTYDGAALTLTWTNGVLQQATNLTGSPGDWSAVPGATNPYPVDLPSTNAMRFFRLRN